MPWRPATSAIVLGSAPGAAATSRTNVSKPAGDPTTSQRAPSVPARYVCGTPRGALEAMRADVADVAARLDVAEAVAATLPHRERYLRLVHALGRRILAAHLDWLDDVERELGGAGGSVRDGR